MKLTKKDMEFIAEQINKNFGEPFLKKDSVIVEVIEENGKNLLSFNIGRRDAQFDEKFSCISSGTFLCNDIEDD